MCYKVAPLSVISLYESTVSQQISNEVKLHPIRDLFCDHPCQALHLPEVVVHHHPVDHHQAAVDAVEDVVVVVAVVVEATSLNDQLQASSLATAPI